MSELTKCNYHNLQRIVDAYGAENVRITAEHDWLAISVRDGICTCKWKDFPYNMELHAEPCARAWKPSGSHFLALTLVCVC